MAGGKEICMDCPATGVQDCLDCPDTGVQDSQDCPATGVQNSLVKQEHQVMIISVNLDYLEAGVMANEILKLKIPGQRVV